MWSFLRLNLCLKPHEANGSGAELGRVKRSLKSVRELALIIAEAPLNLRSILEVNVPPAGTAQHPANIRLTHLVQSLAVSVTSVSPLRIAEIKCFSCARMFVASRSRSRTRSRSTTQRRTGHRNRSKSPFSGRKRHVGSRDAPPTNRCLGVFGLSMQTRERDLLDLFSEHGEVEDCTLVLDNYTGRSRGFAFVRFARMDDAISAKTKIHGMMLHGREVRVDYSMTERAHTPTPGIYLGKPDTAYNTQYRAGERPPRKHGGAPRRRSRTRSRSRSRSRGRRDRYRDRSRSNSRSHRRHRSRSRSYHRH